MKNRGTTPCIILLALWSSLVLAVDEYRLDDGHLESAWGSAGGTGAISFAWLNHFTIQPGLETITGIRVAFGGEPPNSSVPNGTAVTFYLWGDPGADGNPDDATVLASWPGTVANTASDTLNDYPLPVAMTFTAGDSIFAGAIINGLANVPFPNDIRVGRLDEDGTDSIPNYLPSMSSWVAASNQSIPVDPNNLDLAILPVAPVASAFPLPTCPAPCSGDGTWMIRLNALTPGTPILDISPITLDFGTVPVGPIAGPLHSTLSNIGSANLDVSAISGPPAPFFINPFVAGACASPPFSLIPGDSCILAFTFAPPSAGIFTEAISVTSNTQAPGPPPIQVTGQAVDVIIDVSPHSFDFGDVTLGDTVAASFTVHNAFNGTPSGFDLEVTSLFSPGMPAELTLLPGTCGSFPFTLTYQSSCSLELEFKPTTAGSFSWGGVIRSNASAGASHLGITANVVTPPIFQDRFERP